MLNLVSKMYWTYVRLCLLCGERSGASQCQIIGASKKHSQKSL